MDALGDNDTQPTTSHCRSSGLQILHASRRPLVPSGTPGPLSSQTYIHMTDIYFLRDGEII